jgi:hypothetical protein
MIPASARKLRWDGVRIIEVHRLPNEVRAIVKQKIEPTLVRAGVECLNELVILLLTRLDLKSINGSVVGCADQLDPVPLGRSAARKAEKPHRHVKDRSRHAPVGFMVPNFPNGSSSNSVRLARAIPALKAGILTLLLADAARRRPPEMSEQAFCQAVNRIKGQASCLAWRLPSIQDEEWLRFVYLVELSTSIRRFAWRTVISTGSGTRLDSKRRDPIQFRCAAS